MLRHITITAFTAVAALAAMAQKAEPDTLMITKNASRAVITENAGGLKVTVSDLNGDSIVENVYFQPYAPNSSVKSTQNTSTWTTTTFNEGVIGIKVKNHHWEAVSGGFCLGFTNAQGQPADLGLQWNKSLEISWINALAVRYRYRSISVSFGFGFDWRNYKITTSGHRLALNGSGGVTAAPYPEGASSQFSRIKVFSFALPLLYTQKIPGTSISVTAGGILNFNTHASLKTCYDNADGNRVEEYAEHFNHRRVTVDLFGSLNFYKGCGLYVRYSPQTVLQGHNSPEFKPLSAGFILFL